MGILDSKSRILDTILTPEGRKQLSEGSLRIKFATVSDASTFYEYDAVSGSSDHTARIYLESAGLPQDTITFSADDSGKLKPFPNPSGLNVIAGKLVSGSSVVPADGTQFSSLAGDLLGSSIENLKRLSIVSTIDDLFEDDQFELSRRKITFGLTDTKPADSTKISRVTVLDIPSLQQDPRLIHTPNFRFMPPVVSGNDKKRAPIADFAPLSSFLSDDAFYAALKARLAKLDSEGSGCHVTLHPTSHDNNVFYQMFEVNPDGTLTKLDTLIFKHSSDSDKSAIFAGKIIRDAEEYKFVCLFTLVLS